MQRIVYVPPKGSIDLPETCVELSLSPPYILGGVSGTGGVETSLISSAIPGLAGAYVHGVRTETREITCFVHVKGDTREEMYRRRFALARMLAVSDDPGTLYYYNDHASLRIPAYPLSSPSFTSRISNYNRAELRFLCPSPYWESLEVKSGYMAYMDTGFTFPFSFDISFAALKNQTTLKNDGSVPSPLEITILGPADYPVIANATTGEELQINHTLTEGERLFIHTKRGEKSVVIQREGGTEEDAFHYIAPRSVFFQLAPGDNVLKYSSSNESEQTQVFLTYRELFAGV